MFGYFLYWSYMIYVIISSIMSTWLTCRNALHKHRHTEEIGRDPGRSLYLCVCVYTWLSVDCRKYFICLSTAILFQSLHTIFVNSSNNIPPTVSVYATLREALSVLSCFFGVDLLEQFHSRDLVRSTFCNCPIENVAHQQWNCVFREP